MDTSARVRRKVWPEALKREIVPEDVGGPWGYRDFIDALADPNHERHAELKEWIGDTFDPLAFNIDERAKA